VHGEEDAALHNHSGVKLAAVLRHGLERKRTEVGREEVRLFVIRYSNRASERDLEVAIESDAVVLEDTGHTGFRHVCYCDYKS
jgi:hypothetical protein